jgi:hypothetical protein
MGRKRDPKKVEAMAEGEAKGLSRNAAARAAGIGLGGNVGDIAALPAYQARVEEIRAELPWTQGRDPAVLLAALKRAFDGAMAEKKFEATARIIGEAARLRKDRPTGRRRMGAAAADDFDFDAWAAKYGPKS